jgi:iron complex outermembrane receptor protein
MVPGIYVEGTAGPVSNNYSVRGLPGGGQEFIRLIEDGMPAIYGGLNDDEVFQNDLSIDHVEALEGGSSGVLTPNAAGASINFISRKLNFDEGGGLAQVMGTTYGERRADAWYSAPLAEGLAFAVSGYYDSNPGTRDSSFRYDTWHIKLQLEKKFDNGASIKVTYKRWDEHDPYYADQPYAYNNGRISSVPGLDSQFGNIVGPLSPTSRYRTRASTNASARSARSKAFTPTARSIASISTCRSRTRSADSRGCAIRRRTGTSTASSPAVARVTADWLPRSPT